MLTDANASFNVKYALLPATKYKYFSKLVSQNLWGSTAENILPTFRNSFRQFFRTQENKSYLKTQKRLHLFMTSNHLIVRRNSEKNSN